MKSIARRTGCEFVVRARHFHLVAPPQALEQTARSETKPLMGLNVLLVEDQALIATDIEEILLDIGAASVETAHRLSDALERLEKSSPDIAVLDVNLGPDNSVGVATALSARAIPFNFSTGYREGTGIPELFASVPVVRKPTSADALLTAVRQALSGDH